MLDNYPGTFTLLQIHVGDAYATTWGNSRYSFYSVPGTPTAWFDGVESVVGAGSTSAAYAAYLAKYNLRRAVPTDVTIQLTGSPAGVQTYQITANVCIEAGGTGKTLRVHIAQALDNWPIPPDYSRYGFKQAASYQDITLGAGQCQQVVRTFTFDSESWSHQSDMKIVAWAQLPSGSGPANVYQAATMHWPFLTDCNGNGIADSEDIAHGTSEDCDSNGTPDECQPDCNSNGAADTCDLTAGTSVDCQLNNTPDECELTGNDCNANSVPDECDITGATSVDCQPNDTPDECELAGNECNANGIPDDCDIASGTSLDCQPNDVPDECEIEGNDCNANGTPDDCDITPVATSILFDLSSNPGWTTEGAWAFGDPVRAGSYNRDPDTGHTGTNVYGYNIVTGDYSNDLPATYLTSTAIDCSELSDTELRFWRWLGVHRLDVADVLASNDGVNWVLVWSNNVTTFNEWFWAQQTYNIAAVADGASTLYVRWQMGPTNATTTYPGWNIDDIEVWGMVPFSRDCNGNTVPDECDVIGGGDFDADGDVDLADYGPFADCIAGPDVAPPTLAVGCTGTCLAAFDFDADGDIDFADFSEFTLHFGANP
ncbi:MAG: hypothetical protein V2A79_19380 [Planctomycetota bacterium]